MLGTKKITLDNKVNNKLILKKFKHLFICLVFFRWKVEKVDLFNKVSLEGGTEELQ